LGAKIHFFLHICKFFSTFAPEMTKKLILISLLALGIPAFAAKSEPKEKAPKLHTAQLQYRFSTTVGWLNRDDKIAGKDNMTGLTMDRPVVLGGTFALEFLPQDRHTGLRQWNNTSVGLALTVLDLGQKQYLGQVIAPHVYLNVPLLKREHIIFGIRPGMGIGFATKTYANTVPAEHKWEAYSVSTGEGTSQQIANISIGSIANAWLTAGLYLEVPIKKGWSFNFAASWQHLSNGSIMTPNAGYNMFNAEVGATYRPEQNTSGHHFYEPLDLIPHHLYDGVKKKWNIEVGLAGGCRSIYYRDQQWFGVASFSLAAFWNPVSIFRLGGGVDVYYDGGYAAVNYVDINTPKPWTKFGKTYTPESKVENCFRIGISLQPEMVLGKFTFGYHLGIYLYDPVKNMEPYKDAEKGLNRGIFYAYNPMDASTKQDGWFYQKLQLKYHCSKHFFLQMGLKVHIMKAEFIDAGMGLRF